MPRGAGRRRRRRSPSTASGGHRVVAARPAPGTAGRGGGRARPAAPRGRSGVGGDRRRLGDGRRRRGAARRFGTRRRGGGGRRAVGPAAAGGAGGLRRREAVKDLALVTTSSASAADAGGRRAAAVLHGAPRSRSRTLADVADAHRPPRRARPRERARGSRGASSAGRARDRWGRATVVGAAAADANAVVVDTSGMDRVLAIDTERLVEGGARRHAAPARDVLAAALTLPSWPMPLDQTAGAAATGSMARRRATARSPTLSSPCASSRATTAWWRSRGAEGAA